MFKGKRSWFLVGLAVLVLIAVPNANAQTFPNGDMESGGALPNIPPDYWSAGGAGTVSVSTDVPTAGGVDGGLQSLIIDGTGYLDTYTTAYSEPTTPETEYDLEFWYKGNLRIQATEVTGLSVHIRNEYEWKKKNMRVTTLPLTTQIGLYIYDLEETRPNGEPPDGLPLLIDNVSLTANPPAPVVNVITNGDMEAGGFIYEPWPPTDPVATPDYWSGSAGAGVLTTSKDTPWDNGGSQSLSMNANGVLNTYGLSYNIIEYDTEYDLSFWYKGDVYFGSYNHPRDLGGDVGWMDLIENETYEWRQHTMTIASGAEGTSPPHFDLYFYDFDTEDGLPLLIDNVVMSLPVTGPVLLLGDANRDGVVSAGDYAAVQANFGNTGEVGIVGDANLDGVVSAGDYAAVQANFGNTLPPVNAVPEPATIFVVGMGLVELVRRRRK